MPLSPGQFRVRILEDGEGTTDETALFTAVAEDADQVAEDRVAVAAATALSSSAAATAAAAAVDAVASRNEIVARGYGRFEALVEGAAYTPTVEDGQAVIVLADAVHVSTSGSDAAAGARSTPRQTLASAVALATA